MLHGLPTDSPEFGSSGPLRAGSGPCENKFSPPTHPARCKRLQICILNRRDSLSAGLKGLMCISSLHVADGYFFNGMYIDYLSLT